MSAGCGHSHGPFDGMSESYKKRLWVVIFLNAAMFIVEMTAGQMARSQALQADALDFFGDALTYGISMAVIGSSLKTRSIAAAFKGTSLFLMGLWVFGSTIWRVFVAGVPEAPVMGIIGALALAANLLTVLLLLSYKDGDANVRSVWLCSRNDAIGNVIVMIAAIGVWGSNTAWPDLAVAFIMAGLFLTSSYQILTQSWREYRAGGAEALAASLGDDGHNHGKGSRCQHEHH
ncbi:cation transporter [Martelella mediterranea]|uniref:Co/Zn/Cd efflux system component n=1 Tax=Martelella mediterranea TaxID=293089 RepID=A0A4R3NPN5_9HYPH|nr:cation transporter [Martelella mediterranea]TCT37836.1 Co/Zn/Cd efflux system component [Martelella mediterranea]